MSRTIDPGFDPRIADWLEADPDRAPADLMRTVESALPSIPQRRVVRLPWRFPTMNRFVAIAAAAMLLALAGLGLLATGSRLPAPSATQEPSVAPSAAADVPLSKTYDSSRYGYTIAYPDTWTVTPGAGGWPPGTRTLWGDRALDALEGPDARLVAASQVLRSGQTPEEWYQAYCELDGSSINVCADRVSAWRPTLIGGHPGFVTLDGVPAQPGTIKAGGPIYDAVAVVLGRGYEFTLDGAVDRRLLDRLLASVTFTTATETPLDNLTATFTSPLYGYSILVDPAWKIEAATALGDDPTASEDATSDRIRPTGTDTTIGVIVNSLDGQTFDEALAALHQEVLANPGLPDSCKGGDPATWAEKPVGDRTGRELVLCNFKQELVEVNGNVYTFTWSNDTFDVGTHLGPVDFDQLLKTVSFPRTPSPSP